MSSGECVKAVRSEFILYGQQKPGMVRGIPLGALVTILRISHFLLGSVIPFRVARFFLVQNTKTGKIKPNYHKIYQMAIKYFQWQ
jgi:hypothetical protein